MEGGWEQWFYALCYEIALVIAQRRPSLRFNPWFKRLLEHCFPYWTEYKTRTTLKAVDKQVEQLKEQWEKEEREHRAESLAEKAKELFPDATVTPLPNAVVPSVMIIKEAPEGASDDVKALGGELRITYTLEND